MDFTPPGGPPPPKVPAGWTARWNDQYSEWFYVNIHTKKSQWDKPTEPVYSSATDDEAPPGAPPGYAGAPGGATYSDDKAANAYGSNNPYGGGSSATAAPYGSSTEPAPYGGSTAPAPYGSTPQQPDVSEDEALARKLQEEEDARLAHAVGGNRGASDSYYQGGAGGGQGGAGAAAYGQNDLPAREQKKGFLSKITSKLGGSSSSPYGNRYGGQSSQSAAYPQQPAYGAQPAYGQPQQGYYPPQQQAYGGGYGGGYGGARPQRHGLGTGGALALGAGGGLLGGMLLGEAIEGGDNGDGGGGDYGGGDGGGGDFGGGGDMGGGDGGGGM